MNLIGLKASSLAWKLTSYNQYVDMGKVYATTKKRYAERELMQMGFRREGSLMIKRGGCRFVLAEASGANDSFRVTPYVRNWR